MEVDRRKMMGLKKKLKKSFIIAAGTIIIIAFFITSLLTVTDYKRFEKEMLQSRAEGEIITSIVPLESINNEDPEFCLGFDDGEENILGLQYYYAYEKSAENKKELFEMPASITTKHEILDTGSQSFAEVDINAQGVVSIRIYMPKESNIIKYKPSIIER